MRRALTTIGAILAFILGFGLVGALVGGGSYGLTAAPHHKTTVEVTQNPTCPSGMELDTSAPQGPVCQPRAIDKDLEKSTPLRPVCQKGSGIHYYAKDPAARPNHQFGPSLAQGLSEKEMHTAQGARVVTANLWIRLCRDPVLTRSIVAPIIPTAREIRTSPRHFPWHDSILFLSRSGDWDHARLVHYDTPPAAWTMRMVAGPTDPPVTQMVHSRTAGWYLAVDFDGKTILLRVACGGQPTFSSTTHHALSGLFTTV